MSLHDRFDLLRHQPHDRIDDPLLVEVVVVAIAAIAIVVVMVPTIVVVMVSTIVMTLALVVTVVGMPVAALEIAHAPLERVEAVEKLVESIITHVTPPLSG